jgi:group I intron endonuclease
MKQKQSGIYLIKNTVTGKVYVGSSADVDARWYYHRRLLRLNKHDSPKLQNSWNKHGEDAFKFEIIEPVTNLIHLVAIEQTFIDYYKAAESGYNVVPTAGMPPSRLGLKATAETKAKMSASMKKRNGFSEEHQAKLIAAGAKRGKSGKGKHYHCQNGKFLVSVYSPGAGIGEHRNRKYLGSFGTEEEAKAVVAAFYKEQK